MQYACTSIDIEYNIINVLLLHSFSSHLLSTFEFSETITVQAAIVISHSQVMAPVDEHHVRKG